MNMQLRSALVASATALALLTVPAGAALASHDDVATIESNPTDTVTMDEMPPGMHTMMNAPGHEKFMASPGHEHVMNSPGHQAMMD